MTVLIIRKDLQKTAMKNTVEKMKKMKLIPRKEEMRQEKVKM